ncbi:MAG: thioredoxin family protein [Fibrobacter sp.]|nr:thioredoxin family protein [Fibrobacter sp.]
MFTIAVAVGAEEFNMNSMPPPETAMQFSEGTLQKGSAVTVDVVIPEHWHVNADSVTDEFLKPSSLEISAEGITFGKPVWPKAIKEYNEALELEILVFKGEFQITIPVDSVAADYDSLSTKAIFHYQACDNSICLAPAQVTVELGELSNAISGSKSSALGGPTELKKNDEGNLAAGKYSAGEATASQNSAEENSAGTLMLLFFALIGGIILNLMPCVLPVLSLKLFSLISEAGEHKSRLLALGMSTTAGILTSFWILATIISIIKVGGGNAGWGMQFQSAGFIAFMVVILSAFAMSFFGVFEVWLPGSTTTKMDEAGRKQGLAGAFFTGALLVLLSTPCSAPLLGTAMGFAFTASIPVLFLFFTAAGIGLAMPYLLVSVFPKILNVFPKPGIWMVYLQKVMGVLLLGTVVWLLWIVEEQAGVPGVGLFAIVAIASIVASFALGKFAPPGVAFYREVAGFAVGAILIAGIWFFAIAPKYESIVSEKFNAKIHEQMAEDGWYNYSPELMVQFAKAGKTVFVDVSADWCLTCKANEAAVLHSNEFRQAMDSLNVALVKADWTRETPEVNSLLRELGKSGVPAYGIYPKGDAKHLITLPELLTTDGIVEKITAAQ